MPDIPELMKAAVLHDFGPAENFSLESVPVPSPGAGEILVKVHTAGVGVWDPMEREGKMVGWMDREPRFPYIVGSDGAGTVVARGPDVEEFREGDHVYAGSLLNPKGGFYAEYAAVRTIDAAPVPKGLSMREAGVLAVDGVTALEGLRALDLQEGETLLVFGASGGVGHLAVQLAKRMGVRVVAVASGSDGVARVAELDVSEVVDGHGSGLAEALRRLAPDGLDAVLATASGEGLNAAMGGLHRGGRLAWPNGVQPVPEAPNGVQGRSYDGRPGRDTLREMNRLIESGPFTVHVHKSFPLDEAGEAHRYLAQHFVGKLALGIEE